MRVRNLPQAIQPFSNELSCVNRRLPTAKQCLSKISPSSFDIFNVISYNPILKVPSQKLLTYSVAGCLVSPKLSGYSAITLLQREITQYNADHVTYLNHAALMRPCSHFTFRVAQFYFLLQVLTVHVRELALTNLIVCASKR